MTPPPPDPNQRDADNKVLRTRGIVGSKEERQQFRDRRAGILRERALARMSKPQREAFLKREEAGKEAQAAREKRASDDKVLRTRGIVGTKEERQQFRDRRAGILRERALARMSEPQREAFLKREAAGKEAQAAREKRASDDKVMRTRGIVGTKEERQQFRDRRAGILRERALARMSEPQREAFLKREEAAKQARANQEQQKQDAKLRRQVAKVGTKEERARWRRDRDRARRGGRASEDDDAVDAAEEAAAAEAEARRQREEKNRADLAAQEAERTARAEANKPDSTPRPPAPVQESLTTQSPALRPLVSLPPRLVDAAGTIRQAATAQAWAEAENALALIA